ncbi:MAG: ABC transporter permease [Brevundimonas sp.]
MTAIFLAFIRSFVRDRPGLAMTLLLPPLVFLLFAAIFGGSARGEIDSSVVIFDAAPTARSLAFRQGLAQIYGDRLTGVESLVQLEQAVASGRADAGVVVHRGGGAEPRVELVTGAGREIAANALSGQIESVAELARGRAPPGKTVDHRTVGPVGDFQAVYYAGAVSIMFVFFAAMHGAMAGLDERRSGLQARLSLLAGGLAPVMAGRLAALTAIGTAQTGIVFAFAYARLPPLQPWQVLAWLVTALLAAVAAAGLGLAIISACRTRGQAQPLSTFIVLLLAALGGSMAPRYLMPDVFRQLGWATPHAWVIEAHQSVLWLGQFSGGVGAAWAVLAAIGALGYAVALQLERRQMRT